LSALTNRRKINFGVGVGALKPLETKALANEDEVALSSIELDSCPLFRGIHCA